MASSTFLAKAQQFTDAYNASDYETLRGLIADDIHWEHHNRFKGKGADELIQSIERVAGLVPGRSFTGVKRHAETADTLFIEHAWHAVPVEDVPDKKYEKGVAIDLDLVSLFVFRDGLIIEWSDFG